MPLENSTVAFATMNAARCPVYVRFWHFTEIGAQASHVRYRGGGEWTFPVGPLMPANNSFQTLRTSLALLARCFRLRAGDGGSFTRIELGESGGGRALHRQLS
jgi:hypothetical protein